MKTNDPQSSPDLPAPPAMFGPVQPDPLIESTATPPLPPQRIYPVFWPLLVILLTLSLSATRDIIALKKRMVVLKEENAIALDVLKKASRQVEFVELLRTELKKLSPSDPVAAEIYSEFFPPPPSAQKPDSQDDVVPTPAK